MNYERLEQIINLLNGISNAKELDLIESHFGTIRNDIKLDAEIEETVEIIKNKPGLKKLFGNKIISFSAHKDRNSAIGIQDALADLFLLSKTSRIWGSFYSSFSEIAAKLNKTPLEIIQ